MLLDGLAQGTGPLAMYDADVFQMCQISVVQIFIEGGEGFVYRFAFSRFRCSSVILETKVATTKNPKNPKIR